MINDFIIPALCVLGPVALSACGDSAAFEETPFEIPGETVEEGPKETPEETEEEASNGSPEESAPGRVATAFDVAEDRTQFAFDDEPADDDRLPEHGSSFVTRGYIYPFGFLTGREGTDENGAPAYPDYVIGEWTCWGSFIGDDAESESGAWAVSTHIYDFYQQPGYAEHKAPSRHAVVSEGHELAQVHRIVTRSVTGATGLAKSAGGELRQMVDGTNKTGGVNLRLYIHDGFAPLVSPEDLPALPPRDTKPCDWDLFDGERCPLF